MCFTCQAGEVRGKTSYENHSAQEGIASYYGKKFHGKTMANGEPFDMHKMTAAHKKLPFGTIIRVTNPRTHKQVTVEITDRGPYVAGRVLDLSRAAAESLGIISSGVADITYKIVTP